MAAAADVEMAVAEDAVSNEWRGNAERTRGKQSSRTVFQHHSEALHGAFEKSC